MKFKVFVIDFGYERENQGINKTIMNIKDKKRCKWVGGDPRMQKYHDKVWGTPKTRDIDIFEAILLDSFQAGLSWAIILNKRDNFKKAFADFDAKKIAKFSKRDKERLMKDAGIVRNRLKIEATINNAKIFLDIQKEFGSFRKYIWSFTNGKPINNGFKKLKEIPSTTEMSDTLCKDLKKKGFKFMGSTVCYAFMQGIGMVNDHTTDCFRYKELKLKK